MIIASQREGEDVKDDIDDTTCMYVVGCLFVSQ